MLDSFHTLPQSLTASAGSQATESGKACSGIITGGRGLWEPPSRFEQEPPQKRTGGLGKGHHGVGQRGLGKGWAREHTDGERGSVLNTTKS